jgi:hypothetical protein
MIFGIDFEPSPPLLDWFPAVDVDVEVPPAPALPVLLELGVVDDPEVARVEPLFDEPADPDDREDPTWPVEFDELGLADPVEVPGPPGLEEGEEPAVGDTDPDPSPVPEPVWVPVDPAGEVVDGGAGPTLVAITALGGKVGGSPAPKAQASTLPGGGS